MVQQQSGPDHVMSLKRRRAESHQICILSSGLLTLQGQCLLQVPPVGLGVCVCQMRRSAEIDFVDGTADGERRRSLRYRVKEPIKHENKMYTNIYLEAAKRIWWRGGHYADNKRGLNQPVPIWQRRQQQRRRRPRFCRCRLRERLAAPKVPLTPFRVWRSFSSVFQLSRATTPHYSLRRSASQRRGREIHKTWGKYRGKNVDALSASGTHNKIYTDLKNKESAQWALYIDTIYDVHAHTHSDSRRDTKTFSALLPWLVESINRSVPLPVIWRPNNKNVPYFRRWQMIGARFCR